MRTRTGELRYSSDSRIHCILSLLWCVVFCRSVDVVSLGADNYTSRVNEEQLPLCEIRFVDFSADGSWMVTVDSLCGMESLKFWAFDKALQT